MPLFDFNELVNNANSVEDKPKYTILEEGDYEFVIKELPEVNNEKANLKIKAVVASGERAGHTHYHYATFRGDAHPFAAKQTLGLLNATGLSNEQVAQAKSLEDFANYLVNKTFTATVKNRDNVYNGETRKQNSLLDFRPSSVGASGAPGLGNGPAPTPSVSQAPPAPAQSAPQGSGPSPWDAPPQPNSNPGTPGGASFPPPMPFGN